RNPPVITRAGTAFRGNAPHPLQARFFFLLSSEPLLLTDEYHQVVRGPKFRDVQIQIYFRRSDQKASGDPPLSQLDRPAARRSRSTIHRFCYSCPMPGQRAVRPSLHDHSGVKSWKLMVFDGGSGHHAPARKPRTVHLSRPAWPCTDPADDYWHGADDRN